MATTNKGSLKTFRKKAGGNSSADKASELFDQVFSKSDNSPSSSALSGGSPPAVGCASPIGSDHSLGSPPSQIADAPTTKSQMSNQHKKKKPNSVQDETDTDSGSGGDELPVSLTRNESTGLSQTMLHVGLDSPPQSFNGDAFNNFVKPALPLRPSPKRAAAVIIDANGEKRSKMSPPKATIPAPSYKHQWDKGDIDEFDDEWDGQPDAPQFNQAPTQTTKLRRPIYASMMDNPAPSLQRTPIYQQSGDVKIRPVKDAHQCHEVGEVQSYREDVDYLLETLSSDSNLNLRYLSLLNLSKKCLAPEFRQFLRSHGYVIKLFRCVEDAWRYPTLALPTSCVFYLMSRAKVALPVDEHTLFLLVKLMTSTEPQNNKQFDKCRTSVWAVLTEWAETMRKLALTTTDEQPQPIQFNFDITQQNMTTSFLATESLVYICARKNEPWLKKCMKKYGALEHIVLQINQITDAIPQNAQRWATSSVEPMKLLERYLRILESITLHSDENRSFLIAHRESSLLKRCARLLQVCHDLIIDRSTKNTQNSEEEMQRFIATMKLVIRVLCNLSNNNELCCERLGSQDGFLRTCMSCISHVARVCVTVHERFDILVLLLGFVCNIVEHSNTNRQRLLNIKIPWTDFEQAATDKSNTKNGSIEQLPVLAVLGKMFTLHDAAAVRMDEEVDEEMDLDRMGTPTPSDSENEDNDDEDETRKPAKKSKEKEPRKELVTEQDIQQALQSVISKAGSHMEDCMSASYVALLIGCLLQQNEEAVELVREQVPNRSLKPMLERLQQFMEFMEMTNKVNDNSLDAITKVIALLKSLDELE